MEFASPPRKEITYGICPTRIILKYFSPILTLDRILVELESR
jgi:hypothetical protein